MLWKRKCSIHRYSKKVSQQAEKINVMFCFAMNVKAAEFLQSGTENKMDTKAM